MNELALFAGAGGGECGRRGVVGWMVKERGYAERGVVVRWEPERLGCDVLLRQDDGREVWCHSSELRYEDGTELPSKREAVRKLKEKELWELRKIRDDFVKKDWGRAWPGAEWGKGLVGRSLDAAIAELMRELGGDR